MPKYFKIIFALLFVTNVSFSQKKGDVKSIFDEVEIYYKSQKYYSYTSQYKFYENSTTKKDIERKSGIILRKDNVSYQKMDMMESLNFGDYTISINHKEKIFQLSKLKNDDSPVALKSYLKNLASKKIIADKDYWICELTPDKLGASQYEKIRFFINKKDFSLYKQICYMYGDQEIEKNKKKIKIINPRLEIELIKKEKNFEKDTQLIKKSNYFSIVGKKITLSKKFQKYKLIIV